MKKRILAFILCAAMLTGMLAACETETPASADGRTVISYVMWGNDEEVRNVQNAIDQFESEQDWISVEIISFDRADFVAALNTMAAGNNLPDTGTMSEDLVLMWAEQGILANTLDIYGTGDNKPLDSIAFTWEGEPIAYSMANEVLLLFYNRDKFEEAGVAPPPASVDDAWDWDTFIDVAKQMTFDANGNNAHSPDFDKNNVKQYGVMLHADFWQLEVWAVANGTGWYDEQGNVIIDNPAAMESLQMIADLHLVHGVMPQYGTNIATTIEQDLLSTTAMFVNGQWSVGVWLGPAQFSDGLNYGVGVLPYMEEPLTINTGGVTVMFNTTRHPEASKEWLRWYAENSWGLIESGIWMPIQLSWYTDEDLTRKWVENPNFPPYDEYKSAVVDYALHNARPTSWYYVNNTNIFNDLLSTILAPVWNGSARVEDVIPANINALKAASAGR